MYLSFYCKGSKRITQGFTVRGSCRPNRTATYIDPHSFGRQRCVFLVLQGCSTGGPGAKLSAEWWLSLLHLITNWSPKLTGGPEGPFGRVWPSLPHHISDVSYPQLSDFLSWPSYIIVQRPFNRQLNLWNGIFDRHQAEIIVMQFRGHFLPVHQSLSVSWAFTLSHFISQIRLRDFFRLLAIGMCHFLPVHHFGMACLPVPKVNI